MESDELWVQQFHDFYWMLEERGESNEAPLLIAAKQLGLLCAVFCFVHWSCTMGLLSNLLQLPFATMGFTTWLSILACAYVYCDAVSGVVHILLDHTPHDVPVLGVMARGFQYHHHQPRGITAISWYAYASHVHPVAVVLLPVLWLARPSQPAQLFWSLAWCFAHLFQTAHRWAHLPPQELMLLPQFLQQLGLVISPEYHMQHHQSLLDQFSTLNGITDPLFDAITRTLLPARSYALWYGIAVFLFLLPIGLDLFVRRISLQSLGVASKPMTKLE